MLGNVGIKIIDDNFKRSMKKKEEELKKQSATNAKCTLAVENWVQKNFQSQGKLAEGGDGWVPTSQAALNLRVSRRGGGNPQTLIDRGWLKNRWKRLYSDEKAVLESGVDYGRAHDEGPTWVMLIPDPRYHRGKNADMTPKRIKVPQRKILPTHEQIWPQIQKIYKMFLNKVLK